MKNMQEALSANLDGLSHGEMSALFGIISHQGLAEISELTESGEEDPAANVVFCNGKSSLFRMNNGDVEIYIHCNPMVDCDLAHREDGAQLFMSAVDEAGDFVTCHIPAGCFLRLGDEDSPLGLASSATEESWWYSRDKWPGIAVEDWAARADLDLEEGPEEILTTQQVRAELLSVLLDMDVIGAPITLENARSQVGAPAAGVGVTDSDEFQRLESESVKSPPLFGKRASVRSRAPIERYKPPRSDPPQRSGAPSDEERSIDDPLDFSDAQSQLAPGDPPEKSRSRAPPSAPALEPFAPSRPGYGRSKPEADRKPIMDSARSSLRRIAQDSHRGRDPDMARRTEGIRSGLVGSLDRNGSTGKQLTRNTDAFIRSNRQMSGKLAGMEDSIKMRNSAGGDVWKCTSGCQSSEPSNFCRKHGLDMKLTLPMFNANSLPGMCPDCGLQGPIGENCKCGATFEGGSGECPFEACMERGPIGSCCPDHGKKMVPASGDSMPPAPGNRHSPPTLPHRSSPAPRLPTDAPMGMELFGDQERAIQQLAPLRSMLEVRSRCDVPESMSPLYMSLVAKRLEENPHIGLSLNYFNDAAIIASKNKLAIGDGNESLMKWQDANGREIEMKRKGQDLKVINKAPTTLTQLMKAFLLLKQVLITLKRPPQNTLAFEFLKLDLMQMQLITDYEKTKEAHPRWTEAAVISHLAETWDRFFRFIREANCDPCDRKSAFFIFKDFETENATARLASQGAGGVNLVPSHLNEEGSEVEAPGKINQPKKVKKEVKKVTAPIAQTAVEKAKKTEKVTPVKERTATVKDRDTLIQGVLWPGDYSGLCFHFHVAANCFFTKTCNFIHEDKATGKLCPSCAENHPLRECPKLADWNKKSANYLKFAKIHDAKKKLVGGG